MLTERPATLKAFEIGFINILQAFFFFSPSKQILVLHYLKAGVYSSEKYTD